jgi:hypothetical protein
MNYLVSDIISFSTVDGFSGLYRRIGKEIRIQIIQLPILMFEYEELLPFSVKLIPNTIKYWTNNKDVFLIGEVEGWSQDGCDEID